MLRLSPRALSSGASSWSYLLKGNDESSVSGLMLPNSGLVLDLYNGSHETSRTGSQTYDVLRPLKHGKWSRGNDGFLVTDSWGVEVDSSVHPSIWLHETEEKMYLCAYQHKSLTIIFLIPATSVLNADQDIPFVKQKIAENVSFVFLIKLINIFDICIFSISFKNPYVLTFLFSFVIDNVMIF